MDSTYYFEGNTKNASKSDLPQTSICKDVEHALDDNSWLNELVDGGKGSHPSLYPVGWGWNTSGCTGNITDEIGRAHV